MVQKLFGVGTPPGGFESSVVLDGTKTRLLNVMSCCVFESSVVLDGTKTRLCKG